MRTPEQIAKIKSQIEDPRSVENFLSCEEINLLVNLYENADDLNDPYLGKIKKNTGPVTLDIRPLLENQLISDIMKKIEKEIGQFEMTAGFFFKTDYPHIIHNDDTFELPDTVYKAITIPLKIYGNDIIDYPSLCFFDQTYYHGPSKFFKGEKYIPTYYNKQVYDYDDIDDIGKNVFDEMIYLKYFTHLKKSWLEGLTFHSAIKWIPTTAIVFDSVRLHCASDFRKQNIKEKLAISIFTKK
jgi:hypothetical protein